MKNTLPNAGERTVGHRMATYQKTVVSQMDELPTPEQYADCLRVTDYLEIPGQKRVTHVLVADAEDGVLLAQIEGRIPQDWLRGHHWPPKYIQKRFEELGVSIPNYDNCPVQVLSEFEHGKGGASYSIHRLMNNGPFPEAQGALRRYTTKQSLMDELLSFVKNHPNEDVRPFAKALRGWAQEHSIPFTE